MALDVPIYLHPCTPQPAVVRYLLQGLSRAWPGGAGLRWLRRPCRPRAPGDEAAVFDEFPKLRIILGHLGEALPFLLWARQRYARAAAAGCVGASAVIFASILSSPHQGTSPSQRCSARIAGKWASGEFCFAVDWPFSAQWRGRGLYQGCQAYRKSRRDQIFGANARRAVAHLNLKGIMQQAKGPNAPSVILVARVPGLVSKARHAKSKRQRSGRDFMKLRLTFVGLVAGLVAQAGTAVAADPFQRHLVGLQGW